MEATDHIVPNPDKGFLFLSKAPIVEAVIAIHAPTEVEWNETGLKEHLQPHLKTEYPNLSSARKTKRTKVESGERGPPMSLVQDLGWQGFRCDSKDKTRVVQFYKDVFAFSHLRPYASWDSFNNEALKLWDVYQAFAQCPKIRRLGLRYINRLEMMPPDLAQALTPSPQAPRKTDWSIDTFFEQHTWKIPRKQYAVKILRTIQPLPNDKVALIVDIDVSSSQSFEPSESNIRNRLSEMRKLKNEAFFGSVTTQALEQYK